jgi:hypothetical protein
MKGIDEPEIESRARVLHHLDAPAFCTVEQVGPRLENCRRRCAR